MPAATTDREPQPVPGDGQPREDAHDHGQGEQRDDHHASASRTERDPGDRLGHAESVQLQDVRFAGGWLDPDLQGLDSWQVLLDVADGYPGMSFGDGGALAIVAPVADLAAGRYDRLATEPSMY